jgi:hypothetical protein
MSGLELFGLVLFYIAASSWLAAGRSEKRAQKAQRDLDHHIAVCHSSCFDDGVDWS